MNSHYRQQFVATLIGVAILTQGWLPLRATTHIPGIHAEPASAKSEAHLGGRVAPGRESGLEGLLAQQGDFASFFEEGRLSSEDRLRMQRPPNPAITVDKESKYWQYVIFRAGDCSFWMPPGIMSEENVVLNTGVGKLRFRTLASNSDNARYVTAYAEQLTKSQLENPAALLRAIRDRVAPAGKFQLKSDRPITLNTYRGRELSLQSAKETITFRAYLVEDRLYTLGARYPNANSLSRQVAGFLNSFQLLPS